MARKAKHRASTYLDAYHALSQIKTLNFKPTKTRVYLPDESGKKRFAGFTYDFSPQQKATLSRMTFTKEIDDDGQTIYRRSHLYTLAKGVRDNEYDFVKFTGKDKNKKRAFFKSRGFIVTDKGTFNTRENATESKIKKAPEGYRLDYIFQTKKLPTFPGEKIHSYAKRREMFIAFPSEIYGNPDAIAAFIKGINKDLKPNETRVAVNGHQGLTAYQPKELFKYMATLVDDSGANVVENAYDPFINGFYVLFKKRDIEYKKPKALSDEEVRRIRKTGRR